MLLTNQPLAAVTNEAYREKWLNLILLLLFRETMIVKSCKYNQQNLRNLLTETAENVSLTMDLWSSKAKHGYLGVTATWITPNFEIKDVMLEINYVPSPHSSKVVANELYKCIRNWDLEHHVTSITTDNGSNMVSMLPLLNQKRGCENIQRLPCTAHTIQLAIGSACKKTNSFFSISKTSGKTKASTKKAWLFKKKKLLFNSKQIYARQLTRKVKRMVVN